MVQKKKIQGFSLILFPDLRFDAALLVGKFGSADPNFLKNTLENLCSKGKSKRYYAYIL